MYQYIYLSRMTRAMSPEELEALGQKSRRRNLSDGLSGILVAWNGCFLQLLEGERASVEASVERIVQDPRHANIQVVIAGPIYARRFEQWAMEIVDFQSASDAVRCLRARHPPLSLECSFYRDPMLAFSFLYDARFYLSEQSARAA